MKVLLIWDSCGQDSPALYFVTEDADKISELLDSQSTSKDFAMVNTTKPDNYDAISICGWLP